MSTEHPFAQARNWSPDLPASGALMPTDPWGDRQKVTFATERPLALEGGGALSNIDCAFETWGELNEAADNAILICHALTGDSHAAGDKKAGHPEAGWWSEIIGRGRPLDTDRYFIVCANVLGGCQGSTGPASIDPETGRPFGSTFPVVTIRDMVRVQARLGTHLGVDQWLSVVGGSMGGMQVLEWGLMYPDRVRSIMPIATTMAASAWQIGWSAVGRMAVALDPAWRSGEYYDAGPGEGPHAGLALARAVAHITYRSDEVYAERFDRALVDPAEIFGMWDRFQVEGYLDYHGEKLVRRFDANSYLILNKAMDLHDIGRGRGGVASALTRLQAPVMTISIDSDVIYHPRLQLDMCDAIRAAGGICEYDVVTSPHGHDGFLVEGAAVGARIGDFLARVEKGDV